jgi:hypothetical protein
MTTLKAVVFIKNVPVWERVLRIAVALAVALLSLKLLAFPWRWPVALSALAFGLTGVVGFCPACALLRRRPAKRG